MLTLSYYTFFSAFSYSTLFTSIRSISSSLSAFYFPLFLIFLLFNLLIFLRTYLLFPFSGPSSSFIRSFLFFWCRWTITGQHEPALCNSKSRWLWCDDKWHPDLHNCGITLSQRCVLQQAITVHSNYKRHISCMMNRHYKLITGTWMT
jgi:hypothetical protein